MENYLLFYLNLVFFEGKKSEKGEENAEGEMAMTIKEKETKPVSTNDVEAGAF